MVSFVTLDGEVVKFDGDFTVKRVYDIDEDGMMDYFATQVKEIGHELYVAMFICTGGKPIWGMASYGEDLKDMLATEDGETLTEDEKSEVFEMFNDANDAELDSLEDYAKAVVIPQFAEHLQNLDNTQINILDMRKAFFEDCIRWGYFPPDVACRLPDNEYSNVDLFTPIMTERCKVVDKFLTEIGFDDDENEN